MTTKSLKLLLAALLLTHGALSTAAEGPTEVDESRLKTYLSEIESVPNYSDIFAQENAKEALIQRYRSILERYPGFPKSVEIETWIARIYGLDLSEHGGEPPDIEKRIQAFDSILSRYGPQEPYMKNAMEMAAGYSMELYPDKARRLHESIIETYPEDDNLRLRAYESLGRLAARDGQFDQAEEYYSIVMMYDPGSLPSREEIMRAQTARSNAEVSLFWMVRNPIRDEPPQLQLAALKDLFKRYPQIQYSQRRIVDPELRQLEEEIAAENAKKLNKLAQETVDNSEGDGLPAKTKPRRSGFQSRLIN